MIISGKTVLGYLLFACGLAILFTLGWWQLDRGFEKATIAAMDSDASSQKLLNIGRNTDWSSINYRQVELNGRWLAEKTLLLENRLNQGQPGYEVLVPFELAVDRQYLLVNRGWIPKQSVEPGQANANLTETALSTAPAGQLYLPQSGFTLGESLSRPLTTPVRFLYYDFSALSQLTGSDIAPVVLVLDPQHSASFVRIWKPGAISAERHYAYTAQWWGLGLTLLIFGFIWRRRFVKPATVTNNVDFNS